MTPTEYADSIARWSNAGLRQLVIDTIAAAVQAEREACEKIADGYDMPCEPRTESEDTAHSIKIAIMRRGEVTE